MGASSSTKGMPSNRRKVIAGLAAVGIGLAGYGVYATSLQVTGSAGTSLQAGNATGENLTRAEGCDTSVTVTENFNGGTLDGTDGYAEATRTGFTVGSIDPVACAGKTVALAIKTTGDYTQVGSAALAAEATSVTFSNTGSGTVTGYSVKIS